MDSSAKISSLTGVFKCQDAAPANLDSLSEESGAAQIDKCFVPCYPGFEFPKWELPIISIEYWPVTHVLLLSISRARCFTMQVVLGVVFLLGPVLLLGLAVRFFIQLQVEGVLKFSRTPHLSPSQLRGPDWLQKVSRCLVTGGWCPSRRFRGSWYTPANHPGQAALPMMNQYSDSLSLFFAFQILRQVLISLASVTDVSRLSLRVTLVSVAQLMELSLIMVFAPFSDNKNNILEFIATVTDTMAFLFAASSVFDTDKVLLDCTSLLLLASSGTVLVALGIFGGLVGSHFHGFFSSRRRRSSKIELQDQEEEGWKDQHTAGTEDATAPFNYQSDGSKAVVAADAGWHLDEGRTGAPHEGDGVLSENEDDVYCTTYDDLMPGEASMEAKVNCTLQSCSVSEATHRFSLQCFYARCLSSHIFSCACR